MREQVREMKKKKKKRVSSKRRLRRGIIVVFFLLVFAMVGFVGVRLFTVQVVEVEGNELYDASVIEVAVLSDRFSWNSLYVFFKYRFFQKEGQIPFVDTLEISLKSPHKLRVKVYEKGMMGYISYGDEGQEKNAYFDKDGFVVEISEREIPKVPRIDGIQCDDVEVLQVLPIEEEIRKEILVLTMKLKGEDLIPDSIDYAPRYAPVLHYGQVRIQLGSIDNLTQKVLRMKKNFHTFENESGVLHLEKWSVETPNIVFEKDK